MNSLTFLLGSPMMVLTVLSIGMMWSLNLGSGGQKLRGPTQWENSVVGLMTSIN